MLHGGGQTRHSWSGTAAALTGVGLAPINVDMRGHGESDWAPTADYSVTAFATDIAAIISGMPAKPALVGASLGGLTGIMLGGSVAPGSINALVLVDIVPRMNLDGANRIRDFMVDRMDDGFASLEEVADAVAAYNPHRPRPANLEGLKKNLRLKDGRWFWHWDPRFIKRGIDGLTSTKSEVRNGELLTAALRKIDAPLLLVRGRLSDVVTEAEASRFLDEFPHAEYVDVNAAGHMVAGDRNDVFTAAISDFLLTEQAS